MRGIFLVSYQQEEETNGKMFRHIGDISPSKFIHNSPAYKSIMNFKNMEYSTRAMAVPERKQRLQRGLEGGRGAGLNR